MGKIFRVWRERLAAACFAQSRQSAWDRLLSIIHESRNLADAWDIAGPEERTILLD